MRVHYVKIINKEDGSTLFTTIYICQMAFIIVLNGSSDLDHCRTGHKGFGQKPNWRIFYNLVAATVTHKGTLFSLSLNNIDPRKIKL